MNEFNLSERILKYERYGDSCEVNCDKIKDDVKEFIRLLKASFIPVLISNYPNKEEAFNNILDDLAGDELK